MGFSLDYKKSFWFSTLMEFGEDILVSNRKKHKISQTETATRLGLSQSEVSRLERGLTKPKDIVTAQELCNLYKLTPSEKKKYFELIAGGDILPPDLINNLVKNQIDSIAFLNRSGSPKQAIMLAQNLRSWLESNSSNLADHQNEITHLLLEESAAWWDITLPTEVSQYTEPLLTQMEHISRGKNDPNYLYTETNKAFHSYIANNYQNAKQHFLNVLPHQEFLDDLWKMETLRASLITFGKLKDYQKVQELENKANNFISNTKNKSLAKGYILEGLARAYAEFNRDKSLTLFNLAYKHITAARNEPEFMNIRLVQLTRSYLLVLKTKDRDQDKLLELARPALDETEKSGFERHKNQIQLILST